MPLTPEEQAATNQLVAETMLVRLNEQRDSIERIETKGVLLLGFLAVAVQVFAVQSEAYLALRITAFVFYAAAAVCGVLVVRPYQHDFPPPPTPFVARALTLSSDRINEYLAAARVLAFESNVVVASNKAGFWWRMLAALGIALVFSVLSLAV